MSPLEIGGLAALTTVWIMGWGAVWAIVDEAGEDAFLAILFGWSWPAFMWPWIAYKITKWIIT